jgi:predicted metalloprotease
MRWEGRRQSENVEDRRSVGQQVVVGGGLLTLLFMIVLMFLGVDPMKALQVAPDAAGPAGRQEQAGKPIDDEIGRFIKTIAADNEDVWAKLFPQVFKRRFTPPKLVMFTGRVRSGCGLADAGAGPFYCPLDRTVYIDPAFYNELSHRFEAPGDFAQAYVIAHEVGHHVQNLLGISNEVQSRRPRMSEAEYNKLSVRMELQADFLAGVWAHYMAKYAQNISEADIREAVTAAEQIGDDKIQKRMQGYVEPHKFTHGTSEQRVRWFLYGLKTGDPTRMDEAFDFNADP